MGLLIPPTRRLRQNNGFSVRIRRYTTANGTRIEAIYIYTLNVRILILVKIMVPETKKLTLMI